MVTKAFFILCAIASIYASADQISTKFLADSAVTNAKIANGTIDLTSKVTGVLPNANGGIANTGRIKTGYAGNVRSEVARLTCSSSSALTNNFGSWINTLGNITAGECTGTIVGSKFSSTPICECGRGESPFTVGVEIGCQATSTTAFSVDCEDDGGAACTSYVFTMRCTGPE